LLQNYPELGQLNDVNQLEGALRAIRASNPSRYAEITEGLARTRALVAESQRIQQVQQQQQVAQAQRAYANYRNNFNTWADEQDKQYEALALSVPEQERHAIEREARKMLNEAGFTDQQIAMEWHTSPSLRSYFGQRMLWQSARDRLNAHRAHAKRVKTAPHVQRPGSPLHFVPEADYQLRKMERPGKNLSVKEAADFVAARRQAGRRGR
jgi:hypothetical protein